MLVVPNERREMIRARREMFAYACEAYHRIVERSAKNLPKVSVIRVAGLNVYDVLRHGKLLVTRAAISAIEARLGDESGAAAGS